MAATTTSPKTQMRYDEDFLGLLPASKTTEYKKGQMIYNLDNRPRNIYLVLRGTVVLSHLAEDGTEVLLDILPPEELFGESAFLEVPRRSERAQATQNALLMTWTVSDIEDLVAKRPRLGVALLQVLIQRNADYAGRIESFASDSIERRLARSLLRFSERLGTPTESGYISMMPLSQEMLSRYVGTSREIVSHHMSRFRKNGYVDYSRSGITLHRDTLKTVLD
jgi:CRP/FNR family cyclic AMP-dependent transcriptional regulator